jgi:outer membrane lipoprotein-sorting protein
MFKSFFYLINILFFLLINTFAQDAKEIVKKADELMKSNSSYAEMTMTVIKTDWTRTIGMKAWALEPDYAIIYITEPARDKGSVTLKRKKEVWSWVPAAQKIIKIPPSMMLQSWMGSDFTNDDLVKESSVVDDYTHKIMGEEKYKGYDCYKIESIPKPDAGVVWGKLLTWISKENYYQLKTEFYDEDGYIVKTYYGSDIKEMDRRKIPTHWEMVPDDRPGEKTVFDYHEIKFNIDISESFFSEQNMKRVR